MKELRFECGEVTGIVMLWGSEFEVGDWGYIFWKAGLRSPTIFQIRYLVLSMHIVSNIIIGLPLITAAKSSVSFNLQYWCLETSDNPSKARSVDQHNSTILIFVTRTNTTFLRLPFLQAWSTAAILRSISKHFILTSLFLPARQATTATPH
jgi:hypothetical protein